MKGKVYHLSNCKTCQRIIDELGIRETFELQNIKTHPVTEEQLQEMYEMAGSYEALFSRRSTKYKEWGLKDMQLNEQDYKKYLLEHYSFLKRPVIIVKNKIFIGNAKKNVEEAHNFINK